jgi:hypothetical protein
MLALSAQVIARGLGSGGNIAEIGAAYDTMRKATTEALAVRCQGGGSVRVPS